MDWMLKKAIPIYLRYYDAAYLEGLKKTTRNLT
jgi:hypothetical protein